MKELKDLLEPPFEAIGRTVKGADGWEVLIAKNFLEAADELKFAEFTAQALNSEWQRRFGEERWVLDDPDISCPKCKEWFSALDSNNDYVDYNYCPYCGIKMKPLGEANNAN